MADGIYDGGGLFPEVSQGVPDYSSKQKTNSGGIFGGALSTAGGFLMSANPAAGIILTLAGGVLGALTRRKPRRSAQEIYFDNMTNYYYNLGKRSRMSASISGAMLGKKVAPRFRSGADAIGSIPYTETFDAGGEK